MSGVEKGFKLGQCFVTTWSGSPVAAWKFEDASVGDNVVDDADGGIVVEWGFASQSECDAVIDLEVECFDGASGMPWSGHVFEILVEVLGFDFAVGSPKVVHHLESGSSGVSSAWVFDCGQVNVGTSSQKHFL